MKSLSIKQRLFVQEYLSCRNATQAYLRAGYAGENSTARNEACKLLANPRIQTALAEAQADVVKRLRLSADAVVLGLLAEATYTGKGASHSARVKAWAELAKLHPGVFREEQSNRVDHFHHLATKTYDELQRELAATRRASSSLDEQYRLLAGAEETAGGEGADDPRPAPAEGPAVGELPH